VKNQVFVISLGSSTRKHRKYEDVIGIVLVRVTITIMEHHNQKQGEKKRFIRLHFHIMVHYQRCKGRKQTGQEPGGRS
jgi:GR25 family glycosyltransferase involved in LPS biosynthesis